MPKLSAQGKLWLASARKKLQENMESGLKQNMVGSSITIACVRFPHKKFDMQCPQFELEVLAEQFKKFAYGTHVPAYLDGGLSDLPVADLSHIGQQPTLNDLYLSEDGRQQALDGLSTTAKYRLIDQPAQAISSAVHDALERLMRFLK